MRFPKTLFFIAAVLASAVAIPTDLSAAPLPRLNARVAYDEGSQKIVLFGGVTGADSSGTRYYLNDTWEWTGLRWIQVFPETSPAPRAGHVFLYDRSDSRLVLFGGGNEDTDFNDTWAYVGGNWVPIATTGAPPGRRLAAAAYDDSRQKVVIFGGLTQEARLFDTWEFDGTTWTPVNESGPKLINPVMVFDEARSQLLLIGATESLQTEMYRLNGSSWEKLTPETLPACANGSVAVYQSVEQNVLLYGGGCANGTQSVETWIWNGTNWTKLTPGRTPGAIQNHTMAYDASRNEPLLFGGAAMTSVRNSTWRFRSGTWARADHDVTPGPRSLFVFQGDPDRNVTWLFGGRNAADTFGDLWMLENLRWLPVARRFSPASCGYPAGAYDESRKRLVVFCESGEIAEWDGDSWYAFPQLTRVPGERRFAAMAYDAKSRNVVLYGGWDGFGFLRDTWLWNGTAWTEVSADGAPPARQLPVMFYDPNQQKVFLYAGIGRPDDESRIERYQDMWSFDGRKWTEILDVTLPPTRYGAAAAYDPTRNRVIMFGGKNAEEQYLNEQWEWTGTAWIRNDPAVLPSPRMNLGLTFDPVRQRLTMYGGYAGVHFDELWTLEESGWQLHREQPRTRTRSAVRRSSSEADASATGRSGASGE